ncbi:N-acyl homoserine lactonase family protein [Paracoccaceae bacterium]|jgi:N-acyl homoserine lactone hydrolase|nr:N-acyl homoserine lactonase family protein [Paracoccaceae bacterium]
MMRNLTYSDRTGRPGDQLHGAEPASPSRAQAMDDADIKLYMFQTGTLRTQTKFIKMNQGEENFEIPVPWFLIKHPRGNVVIDGGNAAEVAIDKHKHWGDVAKVYDPIMGASEHCVEQCRSVGIKPEDIKYVLQSHLHLDHSGAIGRFPNAQHVVQRSEYEYAFNPDWFAQGAYVRSDFDREGLDWRFLDGAYSDGYDLFGDRVITMIFTPGHSPGHQSFLINLPTSGAILLTIDAAYTADHWNNKALPGLIHSAADSANSVAKLRLIAEKHKAMVVTGHDPVQWKIFRKAPNRFYT